MLEKTSRQKFFKEALGNTAEEVAFDEKEKKKEQQKLLKESEKQLRGAEKIAAERDKKLREMENLKQQTESTQACIDTLQVEQSSNFESEVELKSLRLLKKNHQTEYENKKKELTALEKQAKNRQRAQEKVSRERAKLDEIVQKRNLIEKRLNSTKTLDELNELESELRKKKLKIRRSSTRQTRHPQKEKPQRRIEERNKELARLQTQIAEREAAIPLQERIKEIFKKHGVTVKAILLAAGVTIGAVVSAITKALKGTGKAMAGGLKEIWAKLGSLLPGLIGQLTHFLLITAAKAVGFLAKHTWLLILAVVAFIFQK